MGCLFSECSLNAVFTYDSRLFSSLWLEQIPTPLLSEDGEELQFDGLYSFFGEDCKTEECSAERVFSHDSDRRGPLFCEEISYALAPAESREVEYILISSLGLQDDDLRVSVNGVVFSDTRLNVSWYSGETQLFSPSGGGPTNPAFQSTGFRAVRLTKLQAIALLGRNFDAGDQIEVELFDGWGAHYTGSPWVAEARLSDGSSMFFNGASWGGGLQLRLDNLSVRYQTGTTVTLDQTLNHTINIPLSGEIINQTIQSGWNLREFRVVGGKITRFDLTYIVGPHYYNWFNQPNPVWSPPGGFKLENSYPWLGPQTAAFRVEDLADPTNLLYYEEGASLDTVGAIPGDIGPNDFRSSSGLIYLQWGGASAGANPAAPPNPFTYGPHFTNYYPLGGFTLPAINQPPQYQAQTLTGPPLISELDELLLV
jgi:hypothetical protein